jgi:hypothetical protein
MAEGHDGDELDAIDGGLAAALADVFGRVGLDILGVRAASDAQAKAVERGLRAVDETGDAIRRDALVQFGQGGFSFRFGDQMSMPGESRWNAFQPRGSWAVTGRR